MTKAAVEKVGFCGKSYPHIIAHFKGDIFGILWHTNTFRGIWSKALLTLIDFDTQKNIDKLDLEDSGHLNSW